MFRCRPFSRHVTLAALILCSGAASASQTIDPLRSSTVQYSFQCDRVSELDLSFRVRHGSEGLVADKLWLNGRALSKASVEAIRAQFEGLRYVFAIQGGCHQQGGISLSIIGLDGPRGQMVGVGLVVDTDGVHSVKRYVVTIKVEPDAMAAPTERR